MKDTVQGLNKKPEFSIEQIRGFVKKDYPSVSARICKSLLAHYDNNLWGILVWYQGKGDKYRNETLLEQAVSDYNQYLNNLK